MSWFEALAHLGELSQLLCFSPVFVDDNFLPDPCFKILSIQGINKVSDLYFCQDHYYQIRLTVSIQLGLVVWFCSGQELPAHPCSLSWIRAGRTAITPLNKTICQYPPTQTQRNSGCILHTTPNTTDADRMVNTS